jgi:hypothetical protein
MQSYGGARTGAGQRSVVLAFSKQSMTDDDHDDDDDQESIGRRPKRAALTVVVVLGFFAQNHLVVQLVRRSHLNNLDLGCRQTRKANRSALAAGRECFILKIKRLPAVDCHETGAIDDRIYFRESCHKRPSLVSKTKLKVLKCRLQGRPKFSQFFPVCVANDGSESIALEHRLESGSWYWRTIRRKRQWTVLAGPRSP